MNCKASKAPEIQTKHILGLNKNVSYQTNLASQTIFMLVTFLLHFHKKLYLTLSMPPQFQANKASLTKPNPRVHGKRDLCSRSRFSHSGLNQSKF